MLLSLTMKCCWNALLMKQTLLRSCWLDTQKCCCMLALVSCSFSKPSLKDLGRTGQITRSLLEHGNNPMLNRQGSILGSLNPR